MIPFPFSFFFFFPGLVEGPARCEPVQGGAASAPNGYFPRREKEVFFGVFFFISFFAKHDSCLRRNTSYLGTIFGSRVSLFPPVGGIPGNRPALMPEGLGVLPFFPLFFLSKRIRMTEMWLGDPFPPFLFPLEACGRSGLRRPGPDFFSLFFFLCVRSPGDFLSLFSFRPFPHRPLAGAESSPAAAKRGGGILLILFLFFVSRGDGGRSPRPLFPSCGAPRRARRRPPFFPPLFSSSFFSAHNKTYTVGAPPEFLPPPFFPPIFPAGRVAPGRTGSPFPLPPSFSPLSFPRGRHGCKLWSDFSTAILPQAIRDDGGEGDVADLFFFSFFFFFARRGIRGGLATSSTSLFFFLFPSARRMPGPV